MSAQMMMLAPDHDGVREELPFGQTAPVAGDVVPPTDAVCPNGSSSRIPSRLTPLMMLAPGVV